MLYSVLHTALYTGTPISRHNIEAMQWKREYKLTFVFSFVRSFITHDFFTSSSATHEFDGNKTRGRIYSTIKFDGGTMKKSTTNRHTINIYLV